MAVNVLLVQQAKLGSQEAFVKLIKKNEEMLYNMARKFLRNEDDIADCLQETIKDAYANINKLEKNRYFNTWLCRILINNCKKMINSQKKQQNFDYEDYFLEFTIQENHSFEIRNMLLSLDKKYSIPIVLYYYNGYSIKEISRILSIPVNTVKTRLRRGKSMLKINNI